MAKGDLLQIRLTSAQRELLLSAAGDLSLSEYVVGQLFDLTPRLNANPAKIPLTKRIKVPFTVTPENLADIPDPIITAMADAVDRLYKPVDPAALPEQTQDVAIGKPWSSFGGKMRSMFRRPDGTEYEGWL